MMEDNTPITENNDTDTQAGETNRTIAGGVPAEPAGAPESYDFTPSLPDGAEPDQDTANAFGEICRGMNLTNDQANDLAKYGYTFGQNILAKAEEARMAQRTQWAEETKKALGADYDKTVSACGSGVEYVERHGFPNIRQALNETGAGNRVEIVQALAMLGRLVREDQGAGAAAQAKKDDLYPNTNWDKV